MEGLEIRTSIALRCSAALLPNLTQPLQDALRLRRTCQWSQTQDCNRAPIPRPSKCSKGACCTLLQLPSGSYASTPHKSPTALCHSCIRTQSPIRTSLNPSTQQSSTTQDRPPASKVPDPPIKPPTKPLPVLVLTIQHNPQTTTQPAKTSGGCCSSTSLRYLPV